MNKKQKGGSTSDSIANYAQKQHKMMCGGEYHSPISKAVGPNKVL